MSEKNHLAEKISIDNIIFDVDGTLVNSNEAHALSWQETFKYFSIPFSPEEVRKKIGKGGDKFILELTGHYSFSDFGKEISDYRKELFKNKYLPSLAAFPKTRELFLKLIELGLKPAIATSATEEETRELLKIARVDDLVECKSTASDVDGTKPEPDLVESVLHDLSAQPSQAVMIGDTPYDVEAASNAGVRSIGFLCGGYWQEKDLFPSVAIFDSPADFLEELIREGSIDAIVAKSPVHPLLAGKGVSATI
jgi:phosphoglycolate phosphatase-like HAD superfamily hydrolase